jgi:hypothetical protein
LWGQVLEGGDRARLRVAVSTRPPPFVIASYHAAAETLAAIGPSRAHRMYASSREASCQVAMALIRTLRAESRHLRRSGPRPSARHWDSINCPGGRPRALTLRSKEDVVHGADAKPVFHSH